MWLVTQTVCEALTSSVPERSSVCIVTQSRQQYLSWFTVHTSCSHTCALSQTSGSSSPISFPSLSVSPFLRPLQKLFFCVLVVAVILTHFCFLVSLECTAVTRIHTVDLQSGLVRSRRAEAGASGRSDIMEELQLKNKFQNKWLSGGKLKQRKILNLAYS